MWQVAVRVTFEARAKLSSRGPGFQRRTPKTPAGHSTRVNRQTAHLGPAGKQVFPFCFRGKFELSKARPTQQPSGCYTV